MIDVYEELKLNLLDQIDITPDQADKVVSFLHDNGLLDYDTLKEIYLGGDDDIAD